MSCPSIRHKHSKMDLPLTKAEPIRDIGDTSVIVYLRKGNKHHIEAVRKSEKSLSPGQKYSCVPSLTLPPPLCFQVQKEFSVIYTQEEGKDSRKKLHESQAQETPTKNRTTVPLSCPIQNIAFNSNIFDNHKRKLKASSEPELLVMQYPDNASVLLNSTVWMLCVFEYPREENEEPVVYWRKGLDFHNLQNLQSSPSKGGPQVHITKNILRGFSILKLSNVDQNASNSYFCDVMLTQKIHAKRGNGTKLTVHDFKCEDCLRSDKIWWGWFLLLGYAIFVTAVIITFGGFQVQTRAQQGTVSVTPVPDNCVITVALGEPPQKKTSASKDTCLYYLRIENE
ncbi:hypothetical protein WISP_144061 [Willisornis vidua]|uniref:Ig-like domain-containing protein n=1 Tax=Willisornis vidua TaxID=1566151 RepID=A0ABQ9CLC7_9PASS|nr:hypothetical protein WISP_144061 [Willisornis vidua]